MLQNYCFPPNYPSLVKENLPESSFNALQKIETQLEFHLWHSDCFPGNFLGICNSESIAESYGIADIMV